MSERRSGFTNAIESSKVLTNSLYVGFFLAFLGAAFKMLHYPFCNELLILGFGVIASFYLLASFSDHGDLDKKGYVLVTVFCLSMGLFTIGLLFKWMHWPGGIEMLIIAIMTLGIYYTLKAFLFSIPGRVDNLLRMTFFMAFSIFIVSLLFQIQNWPETEVMKGTGYLALMFAVLIQFRMLHTKGTWLLNITTPVGFAALILFILVTLSHLDSSIPRTALGREFINYEMMDQRMANEVASTASLTPDSLNEVTDKIDMVTADFIDKIDEVKTQLLQLDDYQQKQSFIAQSNPLLPQKILIRDLFGLADRFNGSDVLIQKGISIVSCIQYYQSTMKTLLANSENQFLKDLTFDGMITNFEMEGLYRESKDQHYLVSSMNISLLNELSALQYEALKNRTLILSVLK
jgi:hypothetical protein